jgi:hypothetical protein
MSIPASLLTTTCDVYRPFGAGSPSATGLACRLVADLSRGRGSGLAGVLMWTHYLDLDPAADVLDGCTRSAGSDALLYADGDEVRVPSGGATRYAVVWVEKRCVGTPQEYKRVYLLRDTA